MVEVRFLQHAFTHWIFHCKNINLQCYFTVMTSCCPF